MNTDRSTRRHRSTRYAACLWPMLFAAPHTWRALGSPVGFPGGVAKHRRMVTTPRRHNYDVVVVLLSALAVVVALTLVLPRDGPFREGCPEAPNGSRPPC
jgi:hypothetical protein